MKTRLRDGLICAAEVRSFTETSAVLATGAWTPPPPALRDRVLAETSRTRQLPPEVPAPPAPSRGARSTRWLVGAAASLLVLAVALGGVALQQYRSAQQLEAMTSAVGEVLTEPGRQLVDADFATGRGTVIVAGERVVVVGAGVPDPGDGRAYQLWFIGDDGPRSAVRGDARRRRRARVGGRARHPARRGRRRHRRARRRVRPAHHRSGPPRRTHPLLIGQSARASIGGQAQTRWRSP